MSKETTGKSAIRWVVYALLALAVIRFIDKLI